MQKGDNVLTNIILASRVLLVKMLIEDLSNRTVYFDQESMQSNSTPDPGHHMVKFSILCPGSGVLFENVTKTSYTKEPRGQTFLNR